MVFEATYLVAVLTAGQMSLCCGQYGAQMSKVFRPINKSNGMFICFLMAVERTGSECGLIDPPYANPPLVSSSGPPGACMTPSRETNSSTLTFLMTEFLRVLSDFVYFILVSCELLRQRRLRTNRSFFYTFPRPITLGAATTRIDRARARLWPGLNI